MSIDFPLILVILVFGSGLVWALDAIFLARARSAALDQLQQEYPQWSTEGSEHAVAYRARVAESAAEPVLVEYAKSFFPVLLVVFVLRSFLVEPFQIPLQILLVLHQMILSLQILAQRVSLPFEL